VSALRTTTRVSGVAVAALVLYLSFWPVPIVPVSWDAPSSTGLIDPFAPNEQLATARLVELGNHEGPEDIVGGPDGRIYTATSDGKILRLNQNGSNVEVFADAGGRPLGMEFDRDGNLIIANAYLGLQSITVAGEVSTLVDTFNGENISYADDVAVANDGVIYFSDASSKFGARSNGGTYQASLLDIMEHGGQGRVFRHDPNDGSTTVVIEGLNFANGVAISEDQQFILVNETAAYRIWRYWLDGPKAGTREVIIENLPGFPDNINNGMNDRFWVGLVAPRNELLDTLADKPWLRKLVQRLPAAVRPKAVPSSHVIAITGDGDVLMNLQDTRAQLPAMTGVFETRDALWLSSLFGERMGRLDKKDLAN
jgi:sugar lactone lactonase YvrE